MKTCLYFIVILILLITNPITLTCSQINFYINYNVITFSSFERLIQHKLKNFHLYLEYNPLILIYLNWNKNFMLEKIKNNINNSNIKLFKIKNTPQLTSAQKKWFSGMQADADKKIFSTINNKPEIIQIDKIAPFINILNFKELELILDTISKKNIKKNLNFKIDLPLLLQGKFDTLIKILNNNTNFQYNCFIFSDKRYKASKNEINKFIDLIYSLKAQKKLTNSENKIFNLTYTLFNIKLFNHINDLMLNLFPLTTKIFKKYKISSIEYDINNKKYITLFDKENFFTFDTETGYLKKWFLHHKGVCLINFDSFVEKIYVKKKKNIIPVNLNNITYYKFENGLMFKYDSSNNISIEKNIILHYKKLLLSYKIKNNHRRKQSFIMVIENKFSPSLLNSLLFLKNQFAFYPYKKKFTGDYSHYINSFVNLNTGYGIRWNYYHKINGIEFFKDFYNFTKKIYYKFTLYPYEQKVITISYNKRYIPERKCVPYLTKIKPFLNQYYGDYSIK